MDKGNLQGGEVSSKLCQICGEEFTVGQKICPVCRFQKKDKKQDFDKFKRETRKELGMLWEENRQRVEDIDTLTHIIEMISAKVKKLKNL